MATQARTYKITSRDGNGSRTDLVAATSGADAQKMVEAKLTKFHAVTHVEHTGFRPFRVVPADDDSGTVFETVDGKETITIGPDHPSQAYLRSHFAKQTAEVDEYLDQRSRGEV
ncbi:hypothetical protein J2789_004308 [Variovorax paradoxus]|uniref:hypothetical protein n=1 Tax=Variovorax atrisoli TaxID=3394203 RepID=UPI00119CA16A|nr:hypothetical protein [Variovorax paradoxus]MDR6521621.1 hypothetical protein [Variovorax paradoxus]